MDTRGALTCLFFEAAQEGNTFPIRPRPPPWRHPYSMCIHSVSASYFPIAVRASTYLPPVIALARDCIECPLCARFHLRATLGKHDVIYGGAKKVIGQIINHLHVQRSHSRGTFTTAGHKAICWSRDKKQCGCPSSLNNAPEHRN